LTIKIKIGVALTIIKTLIADTEEAADRGVPNGGYKGIYTPKVVMHCTQGDIFLADIIHRP